MSPAQFSVAIATWVAIMNNENPDKKKPDLKKVGNDFAKYSSIAFEMLVIIGGLTWGGVWLDKKLQNETPWFTIILSPLSVIIALLVVLKDLNRKK